MALVIAQLASPELLGIIQGIQISETGEHLCQNCVASLGMERREYEQISEDSHLRETEKQALIKARRGQGLFRQNVARIEHFCRVTRVDRPEHLIASHIKPWRESDNRERLFEGNGLLLTPTIDHLFDRGFISFENDGELLISPVAHEESMKIQDFQRLDTERRKKPSSRTDVTPTCMLSWRKPSARMDDAQAPPLAS